ncbi:hypothetical protein [Acerihabitans arboris]|uniref:Uncharacterized protein n=1 Tax=Acerihabitans arboris TaxID=2691583 RepID=A0A845SNU1_9GAMM|nr:hypothetical protein [Acerihabitans arboris]NDL64594.1 hypothetical protein [Acerihabitans arboris]
MSWYQYLSYFFGGAVVSNAIPHLVSGMMGRSFQSPFAAPPGQGLSSATVNVSWGAFNLARAYLLIYRVGHFDIRVMADAGTAGLGALLIAIICVRAFGRFHGGVPVA